MSRAQADVDALNDRGQSPLAGAVFKAEPEVVAALLEHGADPDAGTILLCCSTPDGDVVVPLLSRSQTRS